MVVKELGTLNMAFVPENEKSLELNVYPFKIPGTALAMYNVDEPIRAFMASSIVYGTFKGVASLFEYQKYNFSRSMMASLQEYSNRYMKRSGNKSLKNNRYGMSIDCLITWLLMRLKVMEDMFGLARTMLEMSKVIYLLKASSPWA
ncbi:hypothetical protein Nepgr_001045 [Nepenthes gracilis]|uniref:Uncharacterized protein n=1 Tax=Nepenthes gracilis TaxID=150966 RepID=A0AAD3P480_NEPGR|nr:hypothetical protein Nepgr_001045 [Nepenthes gracilis]